VRIQNKDLLLRGKKKKKKERRGSKKCEVVRVEAMQDDRKL